MKYLKRMLFCKCNRTKYLKTKHKENKLSITYEGSFCASKAVDSVLLYGISSKPQTFKALLIT